MTAIDRTAYPRPGVRLSSEELQARYDLSEADHAFLSANSRGDAGRLALATLLKTRQDVGWFPGFDEVEPGIVARLSPYLWEHIRRFGKYDLDMEALPEPLGPRPIPFEIPCGVLLHVS